MGSRDPNLGRRRVVTGLGQIISAVTSTQIDAYSFETLLLVDQQVGELAEKMRHIRCEDGSQSAGHDCHDVQGALIQISLANVADDALRQRLTSLPTSLTLPDADVDALVDAGRTLISGNPVLLKLLAGFAPAADTAVGASPITTAGQR